MHCAGWTKAGAVQPEDSRNNHHCYPIMLWTPEANTTHRGATSLDEDPLVLLCFVNGLINMLSKP